MTDGAPEGSGTFPISSFSLSATFPERYTAAARKLARNSLQLAPLVPPGVKQWRPVADNRYLENTKMQGERDRCVLTTIADDADGRSPELAGALL